MIMKGIMKKIAEQWFGVKTKQQAQRKQQRLSLFYLFVGWNCFGASLYVILKDRLPEDRAERRAAYQSLTLGKTPTMHVYKISGLTCTDNFEITQEGKEDAKEEKAAVETNEY